MLREPKSFGCDIGVYLGRCSVAVFEDVVLVVHVGESYDQSELVPETSVAPATTGAITPRKQFVGTNDQVLRARSRLSLAQRSPHM